MKSLVATVLLACSAVGLAWADAQAPSAEVAAKGMSVSEQIKQIERDWADAMTSGNLDKVAQIVGDDWMGISYDGSRASKQKLLADVKAGQDKAESIEIGPMEVKVLGSVAIVQGSDTEKSTMNGKDTSGKWVWMDVFAKRHGRWVAVRSQSAMIK
jgi:ketosteroid isomerase-like protein